MQEENSFNPNVVNNMESVLGYMSYDSKYADSLSTFQTYQRAFPVVDAIRGLQRIYHFNPQNPFTEFDVNRKFGSEAVLRRRIAEIVLSSFNIPKGSPDYNKFARTVIGWFEATGNKGTLIYLRILNTGAHAGISSIAGSLKDLAIDFGKSKALSLAGRTVPAVGMLAYTVATLLGNAGSGYSTTSYAGLARTVALSFYGFGSLFRLVGLNTEYAEIKKFQAWMQKGAFFKQLGESPAVQAIIAKTIMINKDPKVISPQDMAKFYVAANRNGANQLQRAQLITGLKRYNSAIGRVTSVAFKNVMGSFFATADIAVGVQNVLDSIGKFKDGKPVASALYAATAGFNFTSGTCGLLALMCAANLPLAASLTAGVLICSIISFFTNIAAVVIDG